MVVIAGMFAFVVEAAGRDSLHRRPSRERAGVRVEVRRFNSPRREVRKMNWIAVSDIPILTHPPHRL